jgi:hypothetical protein
LEESRALSDGYGRVDSAEPLPLPTGRGAVFVDKEEGTAELGSVTRLLVDPQYKTELKIVIGCALVFNLL